MTSSTPPDFDWQHLLKAINQISAELDENLLLHTAMRFLLEYSGAQAGCLLLPKGQQFCMEIKKTPSSYNDEDSYVVVENCEMPLSLLHQVEKLQDCIIVHDTKEDARFSHDPYCIQYRPKSLLSTPLTQNKRSFGLVYLEHRFIAHVFTPERLKIINILIAQIVIALNHCQFNAKLQLEIIGLKQKVSNEQQLDEITQTSNRFYFDQHLVQEWRRLSRNNLPLSIVLCRIEGLQAESAQMHINWANIFLLKLATTIQHQLKRVADLLARYDDNTLVVLLPNTNGEGAIHIAQLIQTAVLDLSEVRLAITGHHALKVGFGLASLNVCQESLPEVLLSVVEDLVEDSIQQGNQKLCVENF